MATNENERPWREPATPITRGTFIVMEGLDRAGKTTQVKKLYEELYAAGRNVRTIRFPDRTTPIGQMIDSYLQSKTPMDDHSIHLLFSANRWEKAAWISSSLSAGYTVICDRYYYSGMIYSAAKQNPLLDLNWAKSCDVGLPRPDIVVFLDLDSEEAVKRGGYGDEKYEKREMQERVRELFLDIRYMRADETREMVIVDAGKGIEEVGEKVLGEVMRVVEDVEGGMHLGPSGREVGTVKAWHENVLDGLPEFKAKVLAGTAEAHDLKDLK